jgi:hypothetical protein
MRHARALVGLSWIVALMRNANYFVDQSERSRDLCGGWQERNDAARLHLQV